MRHHLSQYSAYNKALSNGVRHPRVIVDLILALAVLVAVLVPIAQVVAEFHVDQTERQFSKRYTEVCNVEGNLCVIASGTSKSQPFGRLLPGQ
ncbi:MAG: hypothetical protein FJY25_04320 [Betaproteobacteria bacterium]|nr:hypothetical protein [Betaproteobacteria bacterium]